MGVYGAWFCATELMRGPRPGDGKWPIQAGELCGRDSVLPFCDSVQTDGPVWTSTQLLCSSLSVRRPRSGQTEVLAASSSTRPAPVASQPCPSPVTGGDWGRHANELLPGQEYWGHISGIWWLLQGLQEADCILTANSQDSHRGALFTPSPCVTSLQWAPARRSTHPRKQRAYSGRVLPAAWRVPL